MAKGLGLKRDLERVFRRIRGTCPPLLHLILILIGVAIGVLLVKYMGRNEGFEGQKELLLLHMEGCPHCVRLMPEWKSFITRNDTGIKVTTVENKENPELVKKHGVTGFPSILLLDSSGNKLKTYSGPRTADGLLKFCRENI